jgi:hypothetical protein
MFPVRERYGEAFWRAHHEAWIQSELNQREYCEAYEVPLKAFGNWRAKFKAEPQLPERKVLYRRGGLSHALSHGLSHGLSHDLCPTIAPAREGRRRKFSEADKRQILEQAILPDACFAEVARRYGIAERVLFRWKQKATQAAASMFVAVEVADGPFGCHPRQRGERIMKLLPPGVKVHLALGFIDMRKGIDGLAMLVQGVLRQDPFSGHLFVVRGRKANLIKIVFWDGTGVSARSCQALRDVNRLGASIALKALR